MKNSKQDDYYLNTEGNSFFQRNFKDKEVPELRLTKQFITLQEQKYFWEDCILGYRGYKS
jgi:hypothetical protein